MPAAPKFRLTIICESAEAGERAKLLGDQLIAEAAAGEAFELNQWSFGVLGIPEIRNAAASAAAVADIVILSMSGKAALPLRTVAWVEMWTWLIDGHRPVVVALFESETSRRAAIQSYLSQSAFSKKLDFLSIVGNRWDSRALLPLSKAHSRCARAGTRSGMNSHGPS